MSDTRDAPAEPNPESEPNDSTRYLRYAAAGLAYLVAALHLFHPQHGFTRLLLYLQVGIDQAISDPRPVALVLSAIGILVAVKLVLLGVPRRPIYALGILLVATYIVGYFAWHLTGHGGFLPGREPQLHGLAPHEAVIAHMRADPWARVTKAAEAALLAALVALYYRES